jgi:hypothetical protein
VSRRYHKEHKKQIREYHKQYSQSLRGMYVVLRSGAKHRKIQFDLSFEKFCELKNMPCAFTGIPNSPCRNLAHKGEKLYITIDRLTNGAYNDKDAIPLCEHHNNIKNNITPLEVKQLCKIYQEKGVDKRLWKI